MAEGIDAQRGDQWSRPVSDRGPVSPVFVYSLLVATFSGTMVLVSLSDRAPAAADAQLLALHAPEGPGLER